MGRRLIIGKRSDGWVYVRYTNGLDYVETYVPGDSLELMMHQADSFKDMITELFPVGILPEPLKEGLVGK